MTYEFINPEELGVPSGWTNGMLGAAGGRVLFVAGQSATDATGAVTTDDFVEQVGVVLDRILAVVRQAGGGPESIGRMTWFVTDINDYRENLKALGAVYRASMGKHFPAMALLHVQSLVDPRARVEIEATAIIEGSAP